MKLNIEEDEELKETEISIHCPKIDETVLALVAAVRSLEHRLMGLREGRMFVLEPHEVLYFESVDKTTFLYTAKEVYETPMRLYEIEERYAAAGFFRAGKASVINLRQIKVINPLLGGRIEVVLENGEKRVVSRQYAPILRRKLGI